MTSVTTYTSNRYLPMLRAAEGAALFICNAIAGILILCSMRKRSAFVLVGSMITTDAFFGLAHFLSGIQTVAQIDAGTMFDMVPRSSCAFILSNLIFLYVIPLIGLLPLTVSIDRTLAIFAPIRYYKYSFTYSYVLISGSLLLTAAIGTQFLIRGIYDNEMVQASCTLGVFLTPNPLGRKIVTGSRIVFTLTSVLLYIPIIIQMRKATYTTQSNSVHNYTTTSQLITRRLTQSAILNALNSFFLFNVPDIYMFFTFNSVNDIPNTVVSMMLMSRGLVSTAIFLGFHRQLREAVFSTVKCQKHNNTDVKRMTTVLPAMRTTVNTKDRLY